MKELYLFEYLPGTSFLHRLPAPVKLLLLLVFCVLTGMLDSWGIIFPAAVLGTGFFVSASASVLIRQIRNSWKMLLFFAAAGLLRGYTASSAADGIIFSARLIMMMFAGLLFYSTTSLSRLRASMPSNSVTDMMVMSLAILPLIFKTANDLHESRYSRCFGKNRSPFRIIKFTAIPLMIEMFIKTDQMADAWYSRGYKP